MRLHVLLVQAMLVAVYLASLYYLSVVKSNSSGRRHLVVNDPNRPGLTFAINITLLCTPVLLLCQRVLASTNRGFISLGEIICFALSALVMLSGLLLTAILVVLSKRDHR